ncbi:hypothetical protein AHAS_Ahas20G0092500 [Arachis hypogaea]
MQQTREELSTVLGIPNVGAQDKYLGLPSIVSRSKTETFGFIKDKVAKKLSHRKRSFLSTNGREMVIKVKGLAILVYTLSCFKLPNSLLHKLH